MKLVSILLSKQFENKRKFINQIKQILWMSFDYVKKFLNVLKFNLYFITCATACPEKHKKQN